MDIANIILDFGPLLLAAIGVGLSSFIAYRVHVFRHRTDFRNTMSAWAKSMYEHGLGDYIGGCMVYREERFSLWRDRWFLTVYVVQDHEGSTRCFDVQLIVSKEKTRVDVIARALHGNFRFEAEPDLNEIINELELLLSEAKGDTLTTYRLNDDTTIYVESIKVAKLMPMPAIMNLPILRRMRGK